MSCSTSWVRHAATRVSPGSPPGCAVGAKCAVALPGRPTGGVAANQDVIASSGLTPTTAVAALAPFDGARLLHLTDVGGLWGGFDNSAQAATAQAWLDGVAQPWCCKTLAASDGRGSSSGDDGGGGGGALLLQPGDAVAIGAAAIDRGPGGDGSSGSSSSSSSRSSNDSEVATSLPGWVMVPLNPQLLPRGGGSTPVR